MMRMGDLTLQPSPPIPPEIEGYLKKLKRKTRSLAGNWNKRWFFVDPRRREFGYADSRSSAPRSTLQWGLKVMLTSISNLLCLLFMKAPFTWTISLPWCSSMTRTFRSRVARATSSSVERAKRARPAGSPVWRGIARSSSSTRRINSRTPLQKLQRLQFLSRRHRLSKQQHHRVNLAVKRRRVETSRNPKSVNPLTIPWTPPLLLP